MKFFFALFAVALSSPAQAEWSGAQKVEFCTLVQDFAKNTMSARQDGRSMLTLLGSIETFEASQDPEVDGFVIHVLSSYREIIKSAYDEPRFQSPEYIERAIQDFSNTWGSGCYKAVSE